MIHTYINHAINLCFILPYIQKLSYMYVLSCYDKRVCTQLVSTIACNAIPSAPMKTSQRISFRRHGYMIHRQGHNKSDKGGQLKLHTLSIRAKSSCDLNI